MAKPARNPCGEKTLQLSSPAGLNTASGAQWGGYEDPQNYEFD